VGIALMARHWLRVLSWSFMVVLGAIILFAGFTEAGELISAPSDLKVALGCGLIALMIGFVIAGIVVATRQYAAVAARSQPDRPIRVVPTRRSADD
jgi:TRAP-type C4-dicarboxylate transport system permease small subunit